MPSDTQRWLIDIRHNIYRARRFIDGLSYEQFAGNDMAFYAVTRCLEIISEASRRLPPELNPPSGRAVERNGWRGECLSP